MEVIACGLLRDRNQKHDKLIKLEIVPAHLHVAHVLRQVNIYYCLLLLNWVWELVSHFYLDPTGLQFLFSYFSLQLYINSEYGATTEGRNALQIRRRWFSMMQCFVILLSSHIECHLCVLGSDYLHFKLFFPRLIRLRNPVFDRIIKEALWNIGLGSEFRCIVMNMHASMVRHS